MAADAAVLCLDSSEDGRLMRCCVRVCWQCPGLECMSSQFKPVTHCQGNLIAVQIQMSTGPILEFCLSHDGVLLELQYL